MEFAIIAAGEGSRLREEGLAVPKPMLPLLGIPMIERLITIFAHQGATCVHVLINGQTPALKDYLNATMFAVPVRVSVQDTLSSLHSLEVLTQQNPDWESCVVTTTDTVFLEQDFSNYLAGFRASPDSDAYMGVTPFVDDESPLFVAVDSELQVRGFYDLQDADAAGSAAYVSAGIYGLRREALAAVYPCVASGISRMRNYQRSLLTAGLQVKAHVFGKVVDVDHVYDMTTAEEFLKTES
ncbi:nucleotidyltransferase family protein [Sphingobacterium sp. Mn56C]|uniref:nucleotidyltransferase family protein n=1 Tax=Sphingobacterium sp. Mn56C TaxID=3395261 RepID=UPI003BE1CF10